MDRADPDVTGKAKWKGKVRMISFVIPFCYRLEDDE